MEGILFPHGVPEGREGFNEYRARGGYEALDRFIKSSPEKIIQQITDAGLRGRGGAGFPTGKNGPSLAARGNPRYLVLNGGEDEPGSKKDRVLMENLPHLVIEGTILAAYAIGAAKVYLYINANYQGATKSITDALAEAKSSGYWGHDLLGSGFDLDIEMVAAPLIVAGEDTAVPGYRGQKACQTSPPFPVTVGLFGDVGQQRRDTHERRADVLRGPMGIENSARRTVRER
jgi:NADH-quinone oxidoreductase subunit F